MFVSTRKLAALPILALAAALTCGQEARAFGRKRAGRRSVVKVYVTQQREDYTMPWQSGRPARGTGSGFIIDGQRVLSNAHVVSDAKFLELQKDGDPRRYRARVAFAGHDCDLALLTLEDEEFFSGTRPVRFAADLPDLTEQVSVLGYPRGGARLSITRGVVSRIDYGHYYHSGVDQHLVLQVDAAINPGNSGGPVLFRDRVVGLAFQGLAAAENIGYAVPVPVIRRFLEDVADDWYHGYPELGVQFLPTRNAALRADLRLPDRRSGVAVHYVDPFGSAHGLVVPRDVLLSIGGHVIANDGSVELDDQHVLFAELLERRQWGDTITLDLWRDGKPLALTVPLSNPDDPFAYRKLYDRRPRYLIHGGLVFAPLTRPYFRTAARDLSDANRQQLLYLMEYAKPDGLHAGVSEFVVLIRRLPHTVNTYADPFLNGVVQRVNGRDIGDVGDVAEALAADDDDGYDVLEFRGMDDALVLHRQSIADAEPAILARYGIAESSFLGEGP